MFRLTPPRPPLPTEFDEQVAVFKYAEVAQRRDRRWRWLFATLNGVPMSIRLAVKMKRAGMRRGVLDLWFPLPSRGFVGLAGDLKRIKGGVISNEQQEWLEHLRAVGWAAYVWRGAQECIECLIDYLGSHNEEK